MNFTIACYLALMCIGWILLITGLFILFGLGVAVLAAGSFCFSAAFFIKKGLAHE